MYCGPIPKELQDLNFIEMSMISIYNPVTKIRVQGFSKNIINKILLLYNKF